MRGETVHVRVRACVCEQKEEQSERLIYWKKGKKRKKTKTDKNFSVSGARCVRHRRSRINSVCSYRGCTRCAVCSGDREVSPVEQSLKATSARYTACIICWPTARGPVVRQILFSCVSSIAQTAMEITATAWWLSCFRVSLSLLKVPAPTGVKKTEKREREREREGKFDRDAKLHPKPLSAEQKSILAAPPVCTRQWKGLGMGDHHNFSTAISFWLFLQQIRD